MQRFFTATPSATMRPYEGLSHFYLGRPYDLVAGQPLPGYQLYGSKDLTTHAVCVGMTGSGKTGLCLALLEEAGIDGIPAIAIDPKGDLGNLLLTFPNLEPADFAPWIDPAEATRRGLTVEQLAADTARRWREGLEQSDQPADRIAQFRSAVDICLYTPGSNAGIPLAVLKRLDTPPDLAAGDNEALRDRITGTVASLLSLLGIDADPLQSREHILLASLLDHAWREGTDLDLGGLVRGIQSPPLEQIGFVDLETFYPAKDRFALAMRLNNLLASPGFAAWMEGEPLDIQRLFYTVQGQPRLSIVSIAHLSDSERMFFVTLLLHELIAWMRRQPGTSSLRALLYMDEVFGFFPPTANPPAKTPMLTLLKQARAYGLGVVLATQNPVDLDYKGLSNAGTWFLGRLQTERDKARVLDGLEGATATTGQSFDRAAMQTTLSALGNRVFLLHNVHDERPQVFQTRWALSYLRGPLTREQIRALVASQQTASAEASASSEAAAQTFDNRPAPAQAVAAIAGSEQRPVLPPGITEVFVRARSAPDAGELLYRPALIARGTIHFAQRSIDVEATQQHVWIALLDGANTSDVWQSAQPLDTNQIDASPPPVAARYAPLPPACAQPKSYSAWTTRLRDHLYRTARLTLWRSSLLKAVSRVGESAGEFRSRLVHQMHEQRDLEIERLRARYASRLSTADEQIRVAEQRVQREQAQVGQQTMQSAVTMGTSLLNMILGRRIASSTNVTRAGASVRAASRVNKKRQDAAQARETLVARQQKRDELEAAFEADLDKLRRTFSVDSLVLEEVSVAPKKTDIVVESVVLAWTPWQLRADGAWGPLF